MGNSTINKIEKSIILSFIFFIFFLTNLNCHGQGVAINTTGNEADTKALLDISAAGMSSTKGGLLIPRITSAERDAITATPPNPESLVIFNTTTNCFEAYYGSVWQSISCLCSNSPAAAGTISGTATVCPGQIAVLYSVPAIARATSYLWSYSGTGAVIVGTTNTAIVYYS
ncbi:MAG: hypothetical protein HGB12_10160, partial [Bacteroidetes bacterium]|nr:hypothetical protein [Bacteroidota bacterium]